MPPTASYRFNYHAFHLVLAYSSVPFLLHRITQHSTFDMTFKLDVKQWNPLKSEVAFGVLREKHTLDFTKSKLKDNPKPDEVDEDQKAQRELKNNWAILGNSKFVAAAPQTFSSSELVKANANFFQATIRGSINLWRYSISLGRFKERQPSSKNGKRAFIQYLLEVAKAQGLFLTDTFATNYDSIIISSGELFKNETLEISHQPYPEAIEDNYVISTVQSLGKIDFRNLKDLVDTKATSNPSRDYLPDDDIRALNVVSWKKINDPSWKGGQVGNKFYPEGLWREELEENESLRERDKMVRYKRDIGRYWLATGFFTSIRPGQNSLFLNVNVTTSAFYAETDVQKWIDGEKRDKGKGFNELVGRKVVFSKDPDKKQRIIRGIEREPIGNKTFVREEDRKKENISVVQYLEKRKYALGMGSKSFE